MFSKRRGRLFECGVVPDSRQAPVWMVERPGLLSAEHLSTDGTLSQQWVGSKSPGRKDASDAETPPDGWQERKRRTNMHASTRDPERWLYTKLSAALALLY